MFIYIHWLAHYKYIATLLRNSLLLWVNFVTIKKEKLVTGTELIQLKLNKAFQIIRYMACWKVVTLSLFPPSLAHLPWPTFPFPPSLSRCLVPAVPFLPSLSCFSEQVFMDNFISWNPGISAQNWFSSQTRIHELRISMWPSCWGIPQSTFAHM
jgi:hypothetical protein